MQQGNGGAQECGLRLRAEEIVRRTAARSADIDETSFPEAARSLAA